MTNEEVKKYLKKIRNEVNEVSEIISKQIYFIESRKILKKSIEELYRENYDKSLILIQKAKELAIKEKEVLTKIELAESLIHQNLIGADPEEASTLRSKTIQCLEDGNIEEASRLIYEATIAAQPPPEYLVQKARDSYSEASKEYENEHFIEAINHWKNSIEICERAKKIAEEKNDEDMKNNIASVITKSKKCIENAEISLDNHEMVKLDDMAEEKIQKADQLASENLFDKAISTLNKAIENSNDALVLAKKRNFSEDEPKIEKRKTNIKLRIENFQLEKGRYLLQNAIQQMEKSPNKTETDLYSLLDYLNALQIQTEPAQSLVDDCKNAIINTKLALVHTNMEKAEDFYGKKKYYDAREIYENTQKYLDQVEDEAGRLETTHQINEIRKLKGICNENRNSCNSHIFGWPDAKDVVIIKTKETGIYHPTATSFTRLIQDSEEMEKLDALRQEYNIMEKLGSGGYGVVYKATSKKENPDLIIALKVPKEDNVKNEKAFFDEIKSWEDLNHRNIVKLIRPRFRPIPHLVIEYVDGPTLYTKLKKGKLDIKEACHIAFDVAKGLEYSEENGKVHCDLNPKNILFNGIDAKITDFGLAKKVSTTSKHQGTARYNSPEQLKDGIPSFSNDVYQLGLTFYEMITGVNPFDKDDEDEVKKAILEITPPPPSSFNESAKPLDDIIMRCLDKNPENRPALHIVREKISEYLNLCHGEILRVSPIKGSESYVKTLILCSSLAAKMNDMSRSINPLKKASEVTLNKSVKTKLEKLIKYLEAYREEKIPIGEDIINKIEELLKEAI